MPMRIHMVFGETSILVPCGDGKLTVRELVDKAVGKFKKLIAKHPDDIVEIQSVRHKESWSLVDEDDEVVDVLEDKDTVVLDYEYYPHVESDSLRNVDESVIVGSTSQPFSTTTLNGTVEFTSEGPAHSQLTNKEYDGGVGEMPREESVEEDQVTPPCHSQEIHSSQDMMSGTNWAPLTISQENPAINKPSWSTSDPTPQDDPHDSGYVRSQASYGLESQEVYTSDLSQGHTETPPRSGPTGGQLSGEGAGSQSSLRRRSKGHGGSKEELKTTSPAGSKSSLFSSNKPSEGGRFDKRADTLPSDKRWSEQSGNMDIPPGPGRMLGRPGSYSGYPNSYDSGLYPLHNPMYDGRMYPPPTDYPPYSAWSYHNEMYRQYLSHSRHPRPMDYSNRRNLANSRTLSSERLDQPLHPGVNRGYYRPSMEEEIALSQPAFFAPPPMLGHAPYDPHYAMGGPSPGVILSQPASFSGGRGMFDPLERPRSMSKRGVSGRGYSIDDDLNNLAEEELDPEEEGHMGHPRPSPFSRASRKSMFRDGPSYARWMDRCYEHGIQEGEGSEVPEYLASLSQRSRSPSPIDHTPHGEDESDAGSDVGVIDNIHIVELHKGEEPLGVYLTHYTSPDGRDLGVFIGAMDREGFAARSGKVQHQDRILACNGVDFTKELTNTRVEEIFTQMCREPLLRMAISRGAQTDIQYTQPTNQEEGAGPETPGEGEAESADPGTPKIVSNSSQPPTLTLTNTRQIGVKHTITLLKPTPSTSLGFGVTSRDVMTDNKNIPFYIKNITPGTPAFNDGRLKMGDRLLQVNDREVTGLTRSEVVSLLRQAQGEVTLVVSRHEMVEEEQEFPSSPRSSSTPQSLTTVGKTVLTFDIPLPNTGSAGLGISLHGKTSLSSEKRGDMGIYIQSITPGGAAALDGRLHRNDQLLCVNKEPLMGCSNKEALDRFRTAVSKATKGVGMSKGGTVELVVARRVHNPGSSHPPSMVAVGEEPEEEEKVEDDSGREIGIDVPSEAPPTSTLSPAPQGPQDKTTSRLKTLVTQTSVDSDPRASPRQRARATTYSLGGQYRAKEVEVAREPLVTTPRSSALKRSADLMGSGEFDRLEPLQSSSRSPQSPRHSRRRRDLEQSTEVKNRPVTPQSPLSFQDRVTSWYDDAASSVLAPDHRLRTTSMDRHNMPPRDHRDYVSSEYKGHQRGHTKSESGYSYQRGYSEDASSRYHTSLMSRDHAPVMSHDRGGSQRSITSPSDIELQFSSGQSSREGSIQRNQFSPRYDNYQSHYSSNPTMFPSYGGDSAPTRGSGRRDRNRPEKGSGQHQSSSTHYSSHSSSTSPSIHLLSTDVQGGSPHVNGFATIPRSGSRSSEQESAIDQSNAETSSLCSLEHLRLSDSESNAAFRRDEPGRISITKKTKKNPRRDFAHIQLSNVEPMVEGEAPVLIRTGSDGCLNESAGSNIMHHSMQGVEFGPQLGLAKSSSLESLHNVMMHTIKRDMVDDGGSRSTRNSFKRTVDRSYDKDATPTGGNGEQRGVDVSTELEEGSMPALMSYTKNPNNRKSKKSGFFKIFKRKGKGSKKERPASISTPMGHKRGGSVDRILDQENFSEAEKELLKTGFTIPVRLGDDSVEDIRIPGDSRYGDVGAEPQRHSMPIIDDYDSPTDDDVLSTMAKV